MGCHLLKILICICLITHEVELELVFLWLLAIRIYFVKSLFKSSHFKKLGDLSFCNCRLQFVIVYRYLSWILVLWLYLVNIFFLFCERIELFTYFVIFQKKTCYGKLQICTKVDRCDEPSWPSFNRYKLIANLVSSVSLPTFPFPYSFEADLKRYFIWSINISLLQKIRNCLKNITIIPLSRLEKNQQ